MQKIWDFCKDEDIVEGSILIPLLGTGYSKDSSPMESAKAIIDTYFNNLDEETENKYGIRNIIISVPFSYLEEGKINLIKIRNYIQYHLESRNYE